MQDIEWKRGDDEIGFDRLTLAAGERRIDRTDSSILADLKLIDSGYPQKRATRRDESLVQLRGELPDAFGGIEIGGVLVSEASPQIPPCRREREFSHPADCRILREP